MCWTEAKPQPDECVHVRSPSLPPGDPCHLSIRQFDDREKQAAYERQGRRCANGVHWKTVGNDDGTMTFAIEQMEGDHVTPRSKGGKTTADNCQMLCIPCNQDKSGL